jgi:cell division protein FtsB
MTKTAETPDPVLTPTKPKLNRHVVIALRHMGLQDDALTKKIESLTKERDDLRASIKALNAE